MSRELKILAIETSCDDTGIALVECGGGLRKPSFKILADAVSSQIEIHRPFGGVVPTLAKREHIKNLPIVYEKIQGQTQHFHDRENVVFDLIAVTVGPGLEPALWAGINFAEELGRKLKVPVVGANHLEGHIYSNWLSIMNQESGIRSYKKLTKNKKSLNSEFIIHNSIRFPAICLIVSGGHTILLLMKSLIKWQILGETRDDAVGEAFDKVAKMLDLPYPGGPEVEKLALKGKPEAINFPRPMKYDKNYDFSFSGLKTSVLYYLRDHKRVNKSNICASFQQAAVDVLVYKTMKAAEEFRAKSILLCGGVAANKFLQASADFYVPPFKYNTDNAVMIAAAAYINYLQKKSYPLEANGNLSI